MDSNLGDAVILRQITLMAADDHRRIAVRSAAMRGTAQVLRWQSADLRGRAVAAQARARAVCERAARARASTRALQAGSSTAVSICIGKVAMTAGPSGT